MPRVRGSTKPTSPPQPSCSWFVPAEAPLAARPIGGIRYHSHTGHHQRSSKPLSTHPTLTSFIVLSFTNSAILAPRQRGGGTASGRRATAARLATIARPRSTLAARTKPAVRAAAAAASAAAPATLAAVRRRAAAARFLAGSRRRAAVLQAEARRRRSGGDHAEEGKGQTASISCSSVVESTCPSRRDLHDSFHCWALKTYGDSAKTKTVTRKKHNRIVKILKGEEQNSAENSKFRFWVKAKGFRLGPPTQDPTPSGGSHKSNAEQVLYVPCAHAKGIDGNEEAVYKKVAMVENFFDIIYNVHVEMDGRGGKHAGQKRTYKAIAETYAFLPREAVTKFLMQCADCQKRMHAGGSGPPSSGATATGVGESSVTNGNVGGGGASPTASSDHSSGSRANEENMNSACAASGDPPQIDFSLPITTTYLKHMRSLGYSEEDALNPERETATECSSSSVDSESTGEDADTPPPTDEPPLTDPSIPNQEAEVPEMHSSGSSAVNGNHLVAEHSYDKPMNASGIKVESPEPTNQWQATTTTTTATTTPINMTKNGDQVVGDVRSLQDHTYDETMNTCNGRYLRESTATPEDLSSGIKDDDDDDEDESDDRLDSHKYDPERLKAFNMFVRLFVDENLDRMVPISKQPREKIQAIIDSCNRQFPEFAERARKRIRTYLKSCRRTKRTRDHNGWDLVRPTPPHLTSAMAEQILAAACENESNNAKRMRLGLEPISASLHSLQGVDKENSGERARSDPFDCSGRLQSPARPTSTPATLALPRASPQLNGALVSAAATTPTFRSSPTVTSQPVPTDGPPTNGTQSQILRSYLQRPTDLSVKKPSPGGATKCNLNPSEVLAVKQLIAGYRESAAFLIRSADELEQLLLQQN